MIYVTVTRGFSLNIKYLCKQYRVTLATHIYRPSRIKLRELLTLSTWQGFLELLYMLRADNWTATSLSRNYARKLFASMFSSGNVENQYYSGMNSGTEAKHTHHDANEDQVQGTISYVVITKYMRAIHGLS